MKTTNILKTISALILSSIIETNFIYGMKPEKVLKGPPASVNSTGNDWENLLEEMTEAKEENTNIEQWQEILLDLASNPIQLNSATREQLESIPFLSKEQAEAISYYVYRYGPVIDLSELKLVEGLDEQSVRWLGHFVCPGDTVKQTSRKTTLKTILNYGKQELRISGGRSLQNKFGYEKTSAGEQYLGNPWSTTIRYGFNYKNKIQWGLVMQKDGGEKWLDRNHLPDYWSVHLAIRETGRIKALVVGDYSLSFGQGLVCGNSFSLGKALNGGNPEVYGQEIRRHFSAAESGYLRGIAGSFHLGKRPFSTIQKPDLNELILTVFSSQRKLDGNLTDDTFTTISENGLHRTKNEILNKERINMSSLGFHLSFNLKYAELGLTGISWTFDEKWDPTWKPYNCFYFRGNSGGNLSANYRIRWAGSTFYGELASDKNRHLSAIGGVTLHPLSRISISTLIRYYSPEYCSFYGNAFSENNGIRNEKGLFSSVEWRIIRSVRINAFYDVFLFPWLVYGVNAPSYGNEKGIQAILQFNPYSEMTFRVKTKQKDHNEESITEKYPETVNIRKSQYRLQYSGKLSSWNFKTTLDANAIKKTK